MWCHSKWWHCKKKVEPKWLQGGAVFMSPGWPPFRYRFNVEPFSKTAPGWSHFSVGLLTLLIVNVPNQTRQKDQEFGVPPDVQYHSGNLYNHPIAIIYSTLALLSLFFFYTKSYKWLPGRLFNSFLVIPKLRCPWTRFRHKCIPLKITPVSLVAIIYEGIIDLPSCLQTLIYREFISYFLQMPFPWSLNCCLTHNCETRFSLGHFSLQRIWCLLGHWHTPSPRFFFMYKTIEKDMFLFVVAYQNHVVWIS